MKVGNVVAPVMLTGGVRRRMSVRRQATHGRNAYPRRDRPLQLRVLGTSIDWSTTLRGAVCGTLAAAVWAVQQPLDKRALHCGYDDVELLGKAVTRGPGWYPAGLALHLQNGALIGAIYANLAARVPLPRAAVGPVAGLTVHLLSWPLGQVTDRYHPAADDLPKLWGNGRAFAQAAWRHLLFGFVLGELDRRLDRDGAPPFTAEFSSNGSGVLQHAASGEPGR